MRNIDDRIKNRIESPKLIWQADKTLYSERFEDYYFGVDEGMIESEYVYIQANRLEERFQAISQQKITRGGVSFCIAELGFGTGTNFLLSCKLWLKNTSSEHCLHYISFEKYPLSKVELLKYHTDNMQLQELIVTLTENYPFLLPGWHDVYLFEGRIRLTLWFGDVLTGLPEFDVKVDTWFLDGFTPSQNKSMWQPEVFSQMARLSHHQTSFSTFTSAGNVRRGLEEVGFVVKKQAGFSKKREMCFGDFVRPREFSTSKPWFSKPTKVTSGKKEIYIIGAGLAGAAIAYQMAEQGWSVTVLEEQEQDATQASGNLAGAIHPLVTADWNLRSQFYLQGYETTLRWLQPWIEQQEIVGDLNGLIQLAVDTKMQTRLQESIQRVNLPVDFASWNNAEQASKIIGVKTGYAGLYFPLAGWVNPKSVIEKCFTHPNITLLTNQKVVDFEKRQTDWEIITTEKKYISPILVVATAGLDYHLNQKMGLEIRPVKGQVTHLSLENETASLKTTVTHQGYSISNILLNGKLQSVTGATFEAPDLSPIKSAKSNLMNVSMADKAIPDWLAIKDKVINGLPAKVGFRPTSADHLPIIGAVVNQDYATQHYYSQLHTHAVFRYPEQVYQSGLYVSNGHGARGLMSVFLAAEIIANQIEDNQQILANCLQYATHPERFRVRKWRSGK